MDSDPREKVWPGGFRPGDRVIVRRYLPWAKDGCRAGKVIALPELVFEFGLLDSSGGLVPVLHGDPKVEGSGVIEMVPADDLTILGPPESPMFEETDS